jgi:hypothetical protein
MTALLSRIAEKYSITADGCWEWTASRTSQGYGWIHNPGGSQKAHVAVWESTVGPKTPGLELDHLCRNRLCINPDHLEEVTHAENMRRSEPSNTKKTHCRHGHPFDGENLMVLPSGERRCRVCSRAGTRAWRERHGHAKV